MDATINSFIIFLYILGIATLFGGLIAQIGEKYYHVERALLYGAFLELLSSIAFVFVNGFVSGLFITILRFFVIVIILFILLWYYKRKFTWNAIHLVLFLILVDIVLAVFWF